MLGVIEVMCNLRSSMLVSCLRSWACSELSVVSKFPGFFHVWVALSRFCSSLSLLENLANVAMCF